MSDSVAPAAPQPTSPIQGITEPQPNAVPETKAEKPKDDFLAPKFAALTRKEKQIREYERSLRAKEAELQSKFAEYESKSKATQESESQLLASLKKNPLKFMAEHGLTYEQLTEMQLNEQNPTPAMEMQKLREELREELLKEIGGVKETLKEKEEREAKEQFARAESAYKSELSDFVKNNAETYELILANDAFELMYETAHAYYQQSVKDYEAGLIKAPKVPSHEELAKAVEAHLEEQIEGIAKLKKVQSKFSNLKPAEPKQPQTQTAPTLSNTLASEVPKPGSKLMSDEESKREAAKLLRWNS